MRIGNRAQWCTAVAGASTHVVACIHPRADSAVAAQGSLQDRGAVDHTCPAVVIPWSCVLPLPHVSTHAHTPMAGAAEWPAQERHTQEQKEGACPCTIMRKGQSNKQAIGCHNQHGAASRDPCTP